MRMIVRVVVIMMVVVTAGDGIGAGFGIERRLDRFDVAAQCLDKVRDDVVGADTDAVVQELNRQVAVAEVPGDADQVIVLVRVDLQQRFGTCADADNAAVHRQAVAVAQPDRLRQVDQQVLAGLCPEQDATAVATVEVDQDVIDFLRRIPGSGGHHPICSHHRLGCCVIVGSLPLPAGSIQELNWRVRWIWGCAPGS